ncbi:hypothetical protein GLA29479_3990 [Lysobacter antibioticus]|nr:hypothetical protein GLA29479_3990 [Lysobacter antibioticus]
MAADKWSIGFNEPYIAQYLMERGFDCKETIGGSVVDVPCNTNMRPVSFDRISRRLFDLADKQHVGAFREIIPVSLLHPERTNTDRYSYVADVVNLYEDYNLHLILTFGTPVPNWMSGGSHFAPMPESDTTWTQLKNNLSWEMGGLVNYLANDPRISREWLRTRLYVEGFNEFDSVAGVRPDGSVSTVFSTPERAADLQGGINFVLNHYGVVTNQTTPSITGAHETFLNNAGGDWSISARNYMGAYYAVGGGGYPNVHLYRSGGSPPTADKMLSALRAGIVEVGKFVPTAYRGKMLLGEVGSFDLTSFCSPPQPHVGLPIAERDSLYRKIAADPTIGNATHMITFWRLMNLPMGSVPGHPCEPTYGVVHDDDSGYKQVGLELFDYLKH